MKLIRCFLESPKNRSRVTTSKSHMVTSTWASGVMSLTCLPPETKSHLPPEWASPSLRGPRLWARQLPCPEQLGRALPLPPGVFCSWAPGARSCLFVPCTLSHMHEVQESLIQLMQAPGATVHSNTVQHGLQVQ